MKYWHSQTFLAPTKKGVVFFLCAHDTKLKSYKFSVKQLTKLGYDVVAYEFDPDVIHSGNPALLPNLVVKTREDIQKIISSDYPRAKDIGLFGSSLGSFISYNILDIPEVSWVVMNTGGNMARGVWALPRSHKAFTRQGVTLDQLEKSWEAIQNPVWNKPQGTRVLLLASTGDKLATVADARTAHEYMLAHGVNSKFVVMRQLSHKYTIVRNLTRVNWLIRHLPQEK